MSCEDIIIEVETDPITIEMTPEGADGKSLNPRGDWNSSAVYAYRDLVAYQGNSYIALKNVPAGTLPTDTEYWMVNAAGGNTTYWGNIYGTLSNQTDLVTALALKADADDVYTKTEADALLSDKADADSVYTKTEADALLDVKANENDVYTKAETIDLLAEKADASSVYTKTETDDLLDLKADKADVYTQAELDGIFDGIDNALNTKADASNVYTKTQTDNLLADKADASDVYTKAEADALLGDKADADDVYTKSETDDLLSTKANTADLGTLAGMNSIDYTSNYLTNKPTLGSLADQDTVDYATEVTNKPTLGDLAALNSIDYTSNYLTNKPTLGSLADQDTVDYETEVTNKPTLGTMSAESASDYYDKTEVNDLINASGVVAELDASGSIATFETNLAENLIRLNVSIDPVQDLHGYDAPWPAGGGKNILPITIADLKTLNTSGTWTGDTKYTRNDLQYTFETQDGYVTKIIVNGTASATTTFLFAGDTTHNEYVGKILNGCPSGGGGATYNVTGYNFTDGVGFSVYDVGYGMTIPSLTDKQFRLYIAVMSGYTANNITFQLMIRDSAQSATFAPYANVCPISGHSAVNIFHEAEYDQTADPVITISLGDTRYGGTLDVLTGTLTVDRASFTWGAGESTRLSNSKACVIDKSDVVTIDLANQTTLIGAICDKLPSGTWEQLTNGSTSMAGCVFGNALGFRIAGYTTLEEYETFLASNPLQFVYLLNNPVTVTLTPAQIQALIGLNNVWADTGDVALTYFINSTAEAITDVKQMIASTETSMTATRNYTSGSLIIVGPALLKATSNISAGASLVLGTNCVRTTLEDWILSLIA